MYFNFLICFILKRIFMKPFTVLIAYFFLSFFSISLFYNYNVVLPRAIIWVCFMSPRYAKVTQYIMFSFQYMDAFLLTNL